MTLSWNDILLESAVDSPKPGEGGQHVGQYSVWIKLTHKPSMQAVTVYGYNQFRLRNRAVALMEIILDDWDESCKFKDAAP